MSAAELPRPPASADHRLDDPDTLWQRCCARLAMEMPEQQFNTWIRPLPPAEVRRDGPTTQVSVRVPNRFMLDWVRTQYSARIEALLGEEQSGEVKLEFGLAPRAAAPLPTARPGLVMPGRALPPNAALNQAGAQQATPPQQVASEPEHLSAPERQASRSGPAMGHGSPRVMGLNPALTFDNLVPGRANQMARTAALHVAGSPGHMYNPLFIYGGVGLGKTHLMNAVGNALLADKPDARILYLHAEQFISDVVKNYQRKTFDELKAKYHNLDLLLIDDVQFFAGKDRTQEEFFNAFEALLAKKAHIIMTSDTYPKGLANIDERLTSRFDSGLTVAIEPPELEMRVAILIKKAAQEAIELPEDVAFFVAKNVRANVRELEGALRKVLAFAKFSHKEITINLAREALKDLLSIQNRQISVENIQKTVADFYKIKVADMYSKKRPASIAKPRQIAMYLAKELTQKSLPEIGELFGGRDHTTVLHAVRKIGGDRAKDTELNQQLHVLEQTLKG
ncbi:MAG: chromosomal replication initiator protein DnaA [Gammaproteobacteria bacterium]|nr:chromosomal replication initiator protein DnaA [Gammaproteobacteria bacterium]